MGASGELEIARPDLARSCICTQQWIHDRMEFEWDEAKRAANLAKHGLDLADGQALFDGRAAYVYRPPPWRRGAVCDDRRLAR